MKPYTKEEAQALPATSVYLSTIIPMYYRCTHKVAMTPGKSGVVFRDTKRRWVLVRDWEDYRNKDSLNFWAIWPEMPSDQDELEERGIKRTRTKRIGSCTVDELVAYCKGHCGDGKFCDYQGSSGYCYVFDGAGTPPVNVDETIEVPIDI